MRSGWVAALLVGLLILAAGGLAQRGPAWLVGGDPPREGAADEFPSAAAPTPAPGPAAGARGSAAHRAAAAPSPSPPPASAASGETLEAAPGAPPFVTRDEIAHLAAIVLEAASSAILPSAPSAAPAAIPTPTLLASVGWTPVFATAIPGDERVFVLDREGRILVLNPDGSFRATPFLDIRAKVDSSGEGGLLGMAFAPDHATSGEFYVAYTAGGPFRSVIARYTILWADPSRADPGSEQIVLEVDQPGTNHNGGTIAFSPLDDDNLYVGLGDGGTGPGDDPNEAFETAQNPDTLLGSFLRLDVSQGTSGYGIPGDNPFVSDPDVRDEIWSLGWRNPFRWSFDAQTGDLWVGDVGQNDYEEIDFEPANTGGRNYEWAIREGDEPGPKSGDPFGPGTRAAPEQAYDQIGGSCFAPAGGSGSVTGGVLYRGPEPALQGFYFFADFCQNRVWSYDRITDPVEQTVAFGSAAQKIVAFGEDGFGGMLVVEFNDRDVWRVGRTGDQCANGTDDDGDGRADAVDPGCSSADDPSERDPTSACDDGIDNDGDGDIDWPDDPSCVTGPDDDGEIPIGGECSNGVDDDGDRAVDYPDDPGCTAADDPSELDPDVECDDGIDNDGDGDVDHPDDPNCTDPADDREGSSGGGNGGNGCGLGFELVFAVPLLAWARRRARRALQA